MGSEASSTQPLSFRFDGTSPLPLGMEWSPILSSAENDKKEAWSGVPPEAWCFGVSIPSWIEATLPPTPSPPSGSPSTLVSVDVFNKPSPIILYRVLVAVRSPHGVTTSVRLLRRFSDFLKLHSALQMEFPFRPIPTPPPRHRLLFVSSNHSLVSQRRLALGKWMNLILEDLELSRSPCVAAFLDLTEAARAAALASEKDKNEKDKSESGRYQPSVPSSPGGVEIPAGGVETPQRSDDGDPLSSQILEAYLSKRASVREPLGQDSHGCTSELPSPSPPSSLYRVLSGSSLASLPPGIELEGGGEEGPLSGGQPRDEAGGASAGLHHAAAAGVPRGAAEGERSVGGEKGGSQADVVKQKDQTLQRQHPFNEQQPSNDPHPLVDRESIFQEVGSGASSVYQSADEHRGTGGSLLSSEGFSQMGKDFQSPAQSANAPVGHTKGGSVAHQPRDMGEEEGEGEILVVPEERRPVVHRLLTRLQRRLMVAQSDMTALVERLQQESSVNEFLTQKVKDVEGELDLERRQSASAVRLAVEESQERVVAVEWELEEERVKLAEALADLAAHQEKEKALEARLEAAEKKSVKHGKERPEVDSETEQAVKAKQDEMAEMMKEMEKQRLQETSRLKGEVKALAKEVKTLRKALAASEADANESKQRATAYSALLQEQESWYTNIRRRKEQVMHELEVLASKLRDTSVVAMVAAGSRDTEASSKSSSSSPSNGGHQELENGDERLAEHFALLQQSDARIEVILAEARLLQELPDWSGESRPGETRGTSHAGDANRGSSRDCAQEMSGGSLGGNLRENCDGGNQRGGAFGGDQRDGSDAGNLRDGSNGGDWRDGSIGGDPKVDPRNLIGDEIDGARRRLREDEGCDRELLYSAIGLLMELGVQKRSTNELLRHAYATASKE